MKLQQLKEIEEVLYKNKKEKEKKYKEFQDKEPWAKRDYIDETAATYEKLEEEERLRKEARKARELYLVFINEDWK